MELLSEKQLRAWAEQNRKELEKEIIRFFGISGLKLNQTKLSYQRGYNYQTRAYDDDKPGVLSGSFSTGPIANHLGILAKDLKEAILRVDITIRPDTRDTRWETWGRIEILMMPKSARTNRIEPIASWSATKTGITYTSFMSAKRNKPKGNHLISE
jgi:hypothetical protein